LLFGESYPIKNHSLILYISCLQIYSKTTSQNHKKIASLLLLRKVVKRTSLFDCVELSCTDFGSIFGANSHHLVSELLQVSSSTLGVRIACLNYQLCLLKNFLVHYLCSGLVFYLVVPILILLPLIFLLVFMMV
jgi:hypothetical protein